MKFKYNRYLSRKEKHTFVGVWDLLTKYMGILKASYEISVYSTLKSHLEIETSLYGTYVNISHSEIVEESLL